MLDHAMERSRRTSNRRRLLHEHIALLRQAAPTAAVLLASALQVQAQERASEPGSCVAAIRAVLTDIAARDLNTSAGPPLNAFLTLNPSAMAQAEALDRKTAAGDPKGALFCVRGELAAIDIARQNELRLRLGWRAFRSRRGTTLGALAPEKFRALTEELVKSVSSGR